MSNRIIPSQGQHPAGHPLATNASFLPKEYVKGKHEFRANIICLGLFAVVMAGVVGAYFVTNRQRIQITREQEQIQADYVKEKDRIEQLGKLDEENTELLKKAEVTTALIEQIPRSVLMSELVNRLPENIVITEIMLDGKRDRKAVTGGSNAAAARRTAAAPAANQNNRSGSKSRTSGAQKPPEPPPAVEAPRFDYTLKIVGLAQVNNQITDYLKSLQESPILDNVDLKYIKEAPASRSGGEGSEEFRQFEIQAQFKRGADGRRLQQAEVTPATPTATNVPTSPLATPASNQPTTSATTSAQAAAPRPAAAAAQGGE